MEKHYLKIVINNEQKKNLISHIKKFGQNETSGAFFGKRDEDRFIVTDIYFSNEKGSQTYVFTPYSKRFKMFAKTFYIKHANNYKIYNYIGDWHTHPNFSCFPSHNDIFESREDIRKFDISFVVSSIMKVKNDNLLLNAFIITLKDVFELKAIIE